MKTQHMQRQLSAKPTGFTLLEVMVALLIFSIGLLGLAGLQANSLQNNKTADSRSIAVIEAHDMADRIRANARGSSGDYNAVATGIPPVPGANCVTSASCTSSNSIAKWDIFEWQTTLNSSLPSGRGTITRANATAPITITVMWDEARTGAVGEGCGNDPTVDLKCYTLVFMP
jgi:type IV pilus assembly protein PilV